ncbi:MAG TPA: VWA domain-containing protein [Vicinamibacterales bacterium]|nr:VWA domain-containing protein [Vicinamibacterales bacterium]
MTVSSKQITRRRLALLAVGLLTLVVAAPAAGQRGQRFKAGVEVVSLNVTVVDGANRLIRDLEQADFEVFEDGANQEISFFSKTQSPIALALLLDSSASMEDRLQTAQDAATGFVQRLRAEDVAEIVDFDSRVEIRQTFTNDKAALEKAIRDAAAGGSTSLHHAIYISLKELRKIRASSAEEIRRQAIVVLSDGEDTSSILSYEDVLDQAKRSETAIYTIGLRPKDNGSRGFKEAEFVLKQLAFETGGRAWFPDHIGQLAGVYEQIATELASQYTIGYASKNSRRDGAWRRIVVRVKRENVTARTKQGYYAPSATSP